MVYIEIMKNERKNAALYQWEVFFYICHYVKILQSHKFIHIFESLL